MKKLEKRVIEKDDSKTYFVYEGEDALFIAKVRMEFGITNSELAKYCLGLLKAVIENPEIVDYINNFKK